MQSLFKRADSVAQLVEHLTFNERVLGSSPNGITKGFQFAGNPFFWPLLETPAEGCKFAPTATSRCDRRSTKCEGGRPFFTADLDDDLTLVADFNDAEALESREINAFKKIREI